MNAFGVPLGRAQRPDPFTDHIIGPLEFVGAVMDHKERVIVRATLRETGETLSIRVTDAGPLGAFAALADRTFFAKGRWAAVRDMFGATPFVALAENIETI